MDKIYVTIWALFFGLMVSAQQAQEQKAAEKDFQNSINTTWEANKQLSENNFKLAEADYRRAISKSPQNAAAPYNLGNAYYANESYSEAFSRFKQAGEVASSKIDKHEAYHNMGNVFMQHKEYQKAVETYKEALRNNPKDEETRYNLALAKELLKNQQDENPNQQNKDKNQSEDDNQDKEKNQDQKDKGDNNEDNEGKQKEEDNKEGGKDGEEGEQDPKEKDGEGDSEQEKQQPPKEGNPEKQDKPRPNQLSKQQIENLLEAMRNEEKKVQEKLEAKKIRGKKLKNQKDW